MTLPPPPPPQPPQPPQRPQPPQPPASTHTSAAATACYRHPDREAGRRCTRCGKPACVDCLVQAAVGSHCLECAKAARPDIRTRARFWSARQPAIVATTLIALNVLVFLYVTALNPSSLNGRGVTQAQFDLGLNGEVVAATGEWYRLVTSGFLHFGLIHIGFNMYLLYMLGQMLEPAIGRIKFGLVYFAGLLGGSAGALLFERDDGFITVSGGASGAVFGLMGLAFVGYYINGANPLNTSIGTLLMLNLVITFVFPRISIGGHLGGAAAGALCALVVMAPRHRGYPTWAGYAAPVAVAALSVLLAVVTV